MSGRHAVVQDVRFSYFLHKTRLTRTQLQHKIERNEASFKFNRLTDDVYAVSSLLKVSVLLPVLRFPNPDHQLYLRELPEPLFKYTLSDRPEHSEGRGELFLATFLIATHAACQVGDPNSIAQMRSKIRRLPPIHRETLRAVVEHLSRVAAFSEKNKMDIRNLAIVFSTVIFGEEDIPKGGDLLSVQNTKVLDLSSRSERH